MEKNIEYIEAVIQHAGFANRLRISMQEGIIYLNLSEPMFFLTRDDGFSHWSHIWNNYLRPAANALREEVGNRQEGYQPVVYSSQAHVISDDRVLLRKEQRKENILQLQLVATFKNHKILLKRLDHIQPKCL
ncbi:hypothetical protein [Legionella tunisiensis]|uniref:hypothetical protein n=1 Tax=Legionella tunisiensis TaxID=1034944 RepID=UPI0003786244|nr:hypothetical protein [Legionella tunisiensis]